jgi:hypothetical protein
MWCRSERWSGAAATFTTTMWHSMRHAPDAGLMAGYSGTPLAKKLGIKDGGCVFVSSPPPRYRNLLAPLPAGVTIVPVLDQSVDVVHFFTAQRSALERFLPSAVGKIRRDAAIWISWPKKASKVPTDMTEDTIRAVALPMGLVDVKVCAVDDVWSGLKLVIRKEHR